MPDLPLREISRAVATRTSPSLPGRMKVMSPWAATVRSLWLLQAKAKAESASAKMKPPWAMRWPLTISGLTVMASVAWPDLISAISMPRPRLASSSAHIASAQARARSSGESVALTFTAASLAGLSMIFSEKPVSTFLDHALILDVIVVHHDLLRNRFGLAGQDKPRLQLPRLQRIIDVHLRVALDQFCAAGRAHAALAGERQVHACAQRGIEDSLALGHWHVAALAVDDERGHRLRRRPRRHDLF